MQKHLDLFALFFPKNLKKYFITEKTKLIKIACGYSAEIGTLSVQYSDIRLHDLCSKLGQPNCPKSGQTKLGCFGN